MERMTTRTWPSLHAATAGQQAYVEDALARAADGEDTSLLFTGRKVAYTIVDEPDDEQRPWRVRWTIEAENGDTLVLDEWPPLSADEQVALEEAERAEAERVQIELQEAEAARVAQQEQEQEQRFTTAVEDRARAIADEQVRAVLAAAGIEVPEMPDPDEPEPDEAPVTDEA